MSGDNDGIVHRPGVLKQQNKPFKSGRHRSNGEIKRASKGRVNVKLLTKQRGKQKRLETKQDRLNKAQQIRKQKREDYFNQRRNIGALDGVPHIVTIVPLSADIDSFTIIQLLTSIYDDKSTEVATDCGARIYTCPKLRSKFCFLSPDRTCLENVLDAAKMSDSVLFLISGSGLDNEGDYLLDLIHLHCLPNSLYILNGLKDIQPAKQQTSTFKIIENTLVKRCSDAKLLKLDSELEGQLILRKLTEQKMSLPPFRKQRPYIFAESLTYQQTAESTSASLTGSTLKISGYIRGTSLSPNSLVHLPGLGTFQIEKIDLIDFERGADGIVKPVVTSTLTPDPEKQTSLTEEAEHDPMDNEQTWPTTEELEKAQGERHQVKKRVPKGTSEYQAAWMVSDEEDGEQDEDDIKEEDEEDGEMMPDDIGSMKLDDDINEENSVKDINEKEDDTEEMEDIILNDAGYDEKMDLEEDKETLEKLKQAKIDEQFPDEIDTPLDIPARVRFQKYRGLKSFRTTKWDPKENLPADYSRIYQFPNFRHMVKHIQQEQEQNEDDESKAQVNTYVNLYLKNVPVVRFAPGRHVFLIGLLPYEQCLSVLNFVLHRTLASSESNQILKSKEKLIFHVGFRRFRAGTIFSQHTNGTKHKFERYFRPNQILVGTCYGPITYPPAAVLVFKEHSDGTQELVAHGTLMSVNPDRIVLKRLVLSGHPLKIMRKSAVVRYMFFTPEDVNWFKPVEIRTRLGRRGHIKESLGTHGHMKCQFDGIMKSQDTILMNLYKRVFPKWTYEPLVDENYQLQKTIKEKDEQNSKISTMQ